MHAYARGGTSAWRKFVAMARAPFHNAHMAAPLGLFVVAKKFFSFSEDWFINDITDYRLLLDTPS